MKRKNLTRITALAVLFTMLFTGGIFAYWASNVVGSTASDATDIVIGVGETVYTTLNFDEYEKTEGVLVPAGFEEEGVSVSEIVIKYYVQLEDTDAGSTGAVATLDVTHGEIPSPLLNVEIELSSQAITAGGDSVEVTVRVTLDEPANVEEYNTVADHSFDIPLTFTATI